LAVSFGVDGYVLYKTYCEIESDRPSHIALGKYIAKLRDPALLAVLLEDGAACIGILIAILGLTASHYTCNPLYDGLAGVGISCLLGGIGLALVRVNHSFLIGQGVEREMLDGIEKIILNRRSIENVSGIQSQWTGPETFSFKAEVDFDGTYLSALLMPRYRTEFRKMVGDADDDGHVHLNAIEKDGELEVLLSWYAEDVIRAVEREVRHIEAMVRQQYPGAEYIELEPMSKFADRFAIDDSFQEKLLLIEKEELQRWVRVLYEQPKTNSPTAKTKTTTPTITAQLQENNNNATTTTTTATTTKASSLTSTMNTGTNTNTNANTNVVSGSVPSDQLLSSTTTTMTTTSSEKGRRGDGQFK